MNKLVVIERKDVLTVEKPVEVLVYSDSQSMVVVSHGPSIGGTGAFRPDYIQESAPAADTAGATWWNPATEDLMIVHNGQWRRTSQERLTAGAGLEISGGQIRHNLNALPRV